MQGHIPSVEVDCVYCIVFILPDANTSLALGHLHNTISSQQCKYPVAVYILAGDLNYAGASA